MAFEGHLFATHFKPGMSINEPASVNLKSILYSKEENEISAYGFVCSSQRTGFRRKKYVTAPNSGMVLINGLRMIRTSPTNWISLIPQTIPLSLALMCASPA